MKNKLTYIIVALVLTNLLSLGFILFSNKATTEKEVVATIGKTEITRQQWLSKLETAYGYDTLKNLVNKEVVLFLADKYNIDITDEEVERQVEIQKILNDTVNSANTSKEELRDNIYVDLLFKELIIRDVVIDEKDLKNYYDKYQSLYSIPATYHVSQIVTATKDQATQLLAELEAGSAFDVLAMESSIDDYSSSYGGDIGNISEYTGLPEQVFNELEKTSLDSFTKVIEIDGKFYIFYLHEKTDAKEYSFDELKPDLRRDFALSQIGSNFTVETLWEEADVKWFYDK